MEMDRVTIHAHVDKSHVRTRSPRRTTSGVEAGPALPLNVSQLNSMFMLFGIELLGSTAYSCSAIRKSLSTCGA